MVGISRGMSGTEYTSNGAREALCNADGAGKAKLQMRGRKRRRRR